TAEDPGAIVVYEIPLLVETGGRAASAVPWDLVVVADAPAELRADRLVALRGMDRAEAERRIGSQASDADRRAIADVIIDTSGTEQETLDRVDALWTRLTAPKAAG
ncbi:dephospho-CoA kinase, partial [Leucobacter sp. OLES1]